MRPKKESLFQFQECFLFYRITSAKWWTSINFIKNGCTNFNCFRGKDAEILFLLQQKLNFTFKIIEEYSPGFERRNGSWTGAIGEFIILMDKFRLPIDDLILQDS